MTCHSQNSVAQNVQNVRKISCFIMQVCLSENERKNICPQYAALERVRELSEMIDDEYDDEPVKIEEYQASVEMQNTIRQYLDIMERIAVGINTGVYDFDIYCRICGTSTVMYWKQLSHVIEARRKELQRPEIYIEFESLANRIMESKRLAKNHKGDLNERL